MHIVWWTVEDGQILISYVVLYTLFILFRITRDGSLTATANRISVTVVVSLDPRKLKIFVYEERFYWPARETRAFSRYSYDFCDAAVWYGVRPEMSPWVLV